MSSPSTIAFIQARMSSRRFPGKVLAPMWGLPIVAHVVRAVRHTLPNVPAVVLTSQDHSDDPLAAYLQHAGIVCFRGALDDVYGRFRAGLAAHPCSWMLRVCADSPLIGSVPLRAVVAAAADPTVSRSADLITTIAPRTFPKGQNAELIKADTFLSVDPRALTPADREHVTPFFHRQPERFSIHNIESGDPSQRDISLVVDTVDDLHRLECLPLKELARLGCDHLLPPGLLRDPVQPADPR
jgi:spore coat polysaccharide biosynthesis protein SpsF